MGNFMEAMKSVIDDTYNVSITENGALGYATTNKPLLDMNFKVSSYRQKNALDICDDFYAAFAVDKVLAMQWLFYARDCRGGLGERRLFREILINLSWRVPEMVCSLIKFVPEYGRYDDLWVFLNDGHPLVKERVLEFVREQLSIDIASSLNNEPISLLAKWLPSANASSYTTKRNAAIIRKALGVSEKRYRKTLSALRKYTNVVECKMSAKDWGNIDYEAVPSKANLIYSSAFLRNDEERRREFLGALQKGEKKINASTLFPHDIVNKYSGGLWPNPYKHKENPALEALWKALPNTVNGNNNTIVVADGSGSMTSRVSKDSNVTALDVANALAIYFSERSSGQFKDKYITFSNTPQFVDLSTANSLYEKLAITSRHTEVANTNIEAIFNLILDTAVRGHMSQNDLPKNILIISDMEFDQCARCESGYAYRDTRLFENIAQQYAKAGYQMPRLVFWNVCSRTATIPIKENTLGVALVSGFSVNTVKMVTSNKTDPYECLLETLNSPRYLPIKEAVCSVA